MRERPFGKKPERPFWFVKEQCRVWILGFIYFFFFIKRQASEA
jgi:hypothetical protein